MNFTGRFKPNEDTVGKLCAIAVILLLLSAGFTAGTKVRLSMDNLIKNNVKVNALEGSGSGTYLADGRVLSAGHVCEGGVKEIVFWDGSKYSGPMNVEYSMVPDVCLISALEAKPPGATGAVIAHSYDFLEEGQELISVGWPQTWVRSLLITKLRPYAYQVTKREQNLWVREAIFSGNSGGGVYNRSGEVVAVVVAHQRNPRVPLIHSSGILVPYRVLRKFMQESTGGLNNER